MYKFASSMALLAGSLCAAQQAPTPLRVWETTSALSIPAGISMPISGNGGFYARYSSPLENEEAVHWISNDGQSSVAYPFNVIPRTAARREATFDIADMTPLPGGGLAMLGVWSHKNDRTVDDSIELFTQSGGYSGSLPINTLAILPMHIAALKAGFVVQGGASSDNGFRTEELVVMDEQGKVLTTRVLQKLAPASQGAEAKTENPEETKDWQLWEAVSSAKLISGRDGDAYLIPKSGGVSYQVRSDGTIQPFTPEKPLLAEGEKAIVIDGAEADGRLTVESLVMESDAATRGPLKVKRICLSSLNTRELSGAARQYVIQNDAVSAFMVDANDSKFSFLSFAKDPTTGVRQRKIVTVAP